MKRWSLLLLVALILAVPAAAKKTGSRMDPKADLSAAKTFRWLPFPELPTEHPLVEGSPLDLKLRSYIESELRAKGLEPATEGEADLEVIYYSAVDNRLHLGDVEYATGTWVELDETIAAHGARQYEQGTFVIDLVDATSHQLVWTGWATGTARTLPELRRRAEKNAEKTIRKIFRHYPTP